MIIDLTNSYFAGAPTATIPLPSGANVAGWHEGELFVADGPGYRVRVFDGDGKVLRSWGQEGTGEGQFRQILDMAVDGKRVCVADGYNDSVQVFTLQGAFVAALPVPCPIALAARNGVLAVVSRGVEVGLTIHRWRVKGMF